MADTIDKLRAERDDLKAEQESLVALTDDLRARIEVADKRREAVTAAIAKLDEAVEMLSGTAAVDDLSDGPAGKRTASGGSAKRKSPAKKPKKRSAAKRAKKKPSPPSPDEVVEFLSANDGEVSSSQLVDKFGLADARSLSGLRQKAKADDRYEADGPTWKLASSNGSAAKKPSEKAASKAG